MNKLNLNYFIIMYKNPSSVKFNLKIVFKYKTWKILLNNLKKMNLKYHQNIFKVF